MAVSAHSVITRVSESREGVQNVVLSMHIYGSTNLCSTSLSKVRVL